MPEFPGIAHVAVTVSDLERSRQWYQRLFDAEPVLDEHTGTFHHVVWLIGGTLFGIHEHPTRSSSTRFDEFQLGLDHVSFGVATMRSSRSGSRDWTSSASRTAASSTRTTAAGCRSAIPTTSRSSSSPRRPERGRRRSSQRPEGSATRPGTLTSMDDGGMTTTLDPWTALGVDRGATDGEIDRAWKRVLLSVHPDRHPDAGPAERALLEERTREVNRAHDDLVARRRSASDPGQPPPEWKPPWASGPPPRPAPAPPRRPAHATTVAAAPHGTASLGSMVTQLVLLLALLYWSFMLVVLQRTAIADWFYSAIGVG